MLKITQLHIGTTLLLALILHGALAAWLTLSDSKQPDLQKPLTQPVQQMVTLHFQASTPELKPQTPVIESVSELPPLIQTTNTPKSVSETVTKTTSKAIKQQPKSKTTPAPEVKPPTVSKPKPEPKSESEQKTVPKSVSKPVSEVEPKQITKQASQPSPSPTPVLQKEIAKTQAPQKIANKPIVTDDKSKKQYQKQLANWIDQYKKYPKQAKRMRIEGEGILRILINRNGEVQHATLKQSTGNRLLDKAALKMAHKANPFPAMPKNDARQSLEFDVPIEFLLR